MQLLAPPYRRILVSTACASLAALSCQARPGDFDPAFNPGTAANSPVRAVAVDSLDRLVVAGDFTTFNDAAAVRIVRLKEDGAIDPTFNPGTGANDIINAVKILPDGRILVGGRFTQFAGGPHRGLVLLRTDGSVDPDFASGFTADGFSVGVTCLEVLPGGRLMAGGYFTRYAGQEVGRYVFLTSTGSLDADMPRKSGADSHVMDIDFQPDGRILLSGFFRQIDGQPSACVARLLATGSVDPTFSTGTQLSSVAYTVEGLPDGKVLIGGNFSAFFGTGPRYFGRLTASGNLDTSFAGNQAPDLNVYGLSRDAAGRILIAGQFSKLHGEPVAAVGRLLESGALDTGFLSSLKSGGSFIQEYPVDSKGRIIAYGWSSISNRGVPTLCRLLGTERTPRQEWLFQHFGTDTPAGDSAWDATPAGDGLTNLEKYALGFVGNPRLPGRLWGTDGLLHGFFRNETATGFRFHTDLARSDVRATAEWSLTLSDWTNEGVLVTEEAREGSRVTWKVSVAGSPPARFYRMKLETLD